MAKLDEKRIGKVHTGFCSYVQDLLSEPNSEKLKDLVLAFCGVKDLGFDVPTKEKDYIKGAAEYYKGNVSKGDELTPCALGDS